jgi:predicted membrane protein (TIGR00267 family)
MMRFELGLEKPDRRRAPVSAATIGGSYVIGGLVPLIPYMLVDSAARALYFSSAATMLALAIFGAVKGALTGVSWVNSAIQTVLIGGIAATVAFFIARLVTAH